MTNHGFYHAHEIVAERCVARMKCLRVCPTRAIRVRNNKVSFKNELCIDCGNCINACPENTFVPVIDDIADYSLFKYQIALPSPVLYTQFGLDVHPGIIHQSLKNIGFNEVIDFVDVMNRESFALRHHIKTHNVAHPLIMSFCPTIIRLIQVNYPNLVSNISLFDVPREVLAKEIKQTYPQKLGLKDSEIGVIYITPCSAKIVSIKQPAEKERSWIDSAIPIKDIYNLLLPEILEIKKKNNIEDVSNFHYETAWSAIDHVKKSIGLEKCLSVAGLDHVTKIFDDIEKSKLRNIEFIEALACVHECLGGPFCVENPYIAHHNSILLEKKYPGTESIDRKKVLQEYEAGHYCLEYPILPRLERSTDIDISTSIKRMRQKERILMKLPKKDCGLCGCPTCESFAEDCAQGEADFTDCIFFPKK
jgi:iron only hydrogenase large subunit-like protein